MVKHHIYFDEDSRLVTDSSAAVRADDMAWAAVKAFEDGDCLTAAFFLGELSHYIADMSNVLHVIDRESTDYDINTWRTYHNNFELRVVDRTLGRNSFTGETAYSKLQREWFFDAYGLVPIYGFITPGMLAIQMAYETRFGTHILGEEDNAWDSNFYMNCFSKPEELWQDEYWPQHGGWKTWVPPPPGEVYPYNLIKRTEVLLNRAVGYVASALNWVIDQVGGYTCKPNPYAEESANALLKTLVEDTTTNILFNGFFKAMTYVGSFAAVYAIPLSSKVLKVKA